MLIVIRALQRIEFGRYGEGVSEIDPLWAILAGFALAVFFGWRRSRPLDNGWQRGVISVLSVFGAFFLAILAAPAWHFLHFPGLLLLGLVSFALGVAGSRWAVRGASERV